MCLIFIFNGTTKCERSSREQLDPISLCFHTPLPNSLATPNQ